MGNAVDHKASELAMADVDGARPDPLVGTVVNGKFHVRSAIARGGMGRIYFATQVPLERPVALKVVQADGDREHESQFLKRFLQEASILAKLQHPNVVTLFDYGRIENSPVERYFIAMEYLAGETLAHRLAARAPLPSSEALVLFRQIARGLREAHARGVVHRDLKPSNIILVPEGDGGELVKLVDFGIGKVLERGPGGDDLTQDGMMVGTPKYMAPEQFEGTASPASDLYSLGTILFQALTNRLPFQGNTLAEFMVAKFAHPVPRLREVNPGCDASERLEGLVLRLLARAPEQRPSLEEIFGQLAACEEETFGTSAGRRMATGGYHAAMLAPPPGSVTPPPSVPQTGSYPRAPMSSSGQRDPSGAFGPMAMGPGSGPMMPPHGMTPGSLRVPPTVVASTMPGPMSSASPTPAPSHMPAGPYATGTPGASGSRVGLGLAIAAFVLLLGGGALYAARATTARGEAGGGAGEGSPTSSAGTTAAATADPNAGAFTVSIDSNPPGANVYEGERLVGVTPTQLRVERVTVSREPRTFTIKKDGFVATTLVQGPSDGDVRSVVALAADPATGRAKPGAGAATGTKPGTKPTTTTTQPQNPGTDIRLTR